MPVAFGDGYRRYFSEALADLSVDDVVAHVDTLTPVSTVHKTSGRICGRHHTLAQCRGVQNLIAQHKSRELALRGMSKPFSHRGNSWTTKKTVQFGARARTPFADRGGRSGGGKGAAGSNSGGSGVHGNCGHYGSRGSPSGP